MKKLNETEAELKKTLLTKIKKKKVHNKNVHYFSARLITHSI